MKSDLSKLKNTSIDIQGYDKGTHSTITQLLDLQINDTTARDVLTNLKDRADNFSKELIVKAEQLHDKVVADNKFYNEVKTKGLITTSVAKVTALLR